MKTNSGLVAYAKAQLGKPYWYGTYGQEATSILYASKKNQYPSYYTANDFNTQFGKKVHDCIGLIKGYLWSDNENAQPKYNAEQDKSASGMYKISTEKGTMDSFPAYNGTLVYMGSSVDKIYHVGVYVDGYVIEAQGHSTGVVKTIFSKTRWQYWSQCPFIECDTKNAPLPAIGTVTVAQNVKAIQSWLNEDYETLGVNLVVDGVYGKETKKALIKAWQYTVGGLEVDGIYGPISANKAAKNVICKGSEGRLVMIWQAFLVCKGYNPNGIDGEFGNGCKVSTRLYQENNGLDPDGCVGRNTWSQAFA